MRGTGGTWFEESDGAENRIALMRNQHTTPILPKYTANREVNWDERYAIVHSQRQNSEGERATGRTNIVPP